MVGYAVATFALILFAKSATAITAQDQKFVTNIAHRGVEHAALLKLGEKQIQSPNLLAFARAGLNERNALDKELRALAATKAVRVSDENLNTVIGNNPKLGPLAWGAGYAGSGGVISSYDKRWTAVMEDFVRADLQDCLDETNKGTDPQFKAWAVKTFQTLKNRLLLLMDMRKNLK
jgi:hypothetical protein